MRTPSHMSPRRQAGSPPASSASAKMASAVARSWQSGVMQSSESAGTWAEGMATVINSIIDDNSASSIAGGVRAFNLRIANSTLARNAALAGYQRVRQRLLHPLRQLALVHRCDT